MKQIFCKKYTCAVAAMLAGVVGFSSCSNDDELIANPAPGSGEVVKTQFAINIPAGTASTRLAQDIVQGQETPVFRGMQDIFLLPFDLANAGTAVVGATDTLSSAAIPLPQLATGGLSDLTSNGGKYKVYDDIEIPVGTTNFVFYAKALDNTSKANGALVPSYNTSANMPVVDTEIQTVTFSPQPWYNSATQSATLSAAQDALEEALNTIAGAKVGEDPGATTWASTGASTPAEGSVGEYYNEFIKLKAGSAASILAAVQDLYTAMGSDRVTETLDSGIKDAVRTAITTAGFSVDGKGTLSYGTTLSAYKDFPRGLGLPDGSMQLTFAEGKFTYANPSNSQGNILEQTAYVNYVHPAALYYWANTTLKASGDSQADNIASQDSWDEVIGTVYGSASNEVEASTRSVALVSSINYAVAQLELKARFNNQDGANSILDKAGASVAIPEDGFPFTGLLIGDQKQVGWNFEQGDGASTATSYTIYDNAIFQGASTTANAAVVKGYEEFNAIEPVYTLALQSAGESGEAETVRFALELQNKSGSAFTGVDGIVPAGGTFYLIGELETKYDENSSEETEPARITHVFKQDYKTTARVSISSLANAYNCIPDLREPQLELALSVDLEWRQGLDADVTIE